MTVGPMQWTRDGMVAALAGGPAGLLRPAQGPDEPSEDDEDDISEMAASMVAKPSRSKPPRPAPKAPEPINVLRLAKVRLREVRRELRRMRDLEQERAELERLIAAAENKPVSLRALPRKTTAG